MAHRFFVNSINDIVHIEGEEFVHLSKVLRLKVGDEVECICEDDYLYNGVITDINKTSASVKITNKTKNLKNPKVDVTVFQALPKGDKLDLIVQKLSEIGVNTLQPFVSKYCVAKSCNKIDRLNKISKSASKQCGRSRSLVVNECITFEQLLNELQKYDTVIFANETERKQNDFKINNNDKIAIIIGSEGGFAEEEIKLLSDKATSVTFGHRIFRTETASIVISAIVLYKAGELQ